jgi:hypothetical protein
MCLRPHGCARLVRGRHWSGPSALWFVSWHFPQGVALGWDRARLWRLCAACGPRHVGGWRLETGGRFQDFWMTPSRRHRADRHPHACPMPPLRGSCLFSCLYPMAHAMGYPMPPLPRLRHRTDARARREAGDWRLEAGDWRLETGGWRGAGFLDGLRDRRRHREWFAPTRHACAGVSHGVATLGSPRRQPWGRRGSAEKPRQGRHRSAVPTVGLFDCWTVRRRW